MKAIIPESKFTKVLHTYLNMSFKGFDDCTYDWANFNCGMGVCCDPYAIGFVLPESEYDDYLFKLADSENYDDDGDYAEELKGELPEPCHNPPNISNPEFDTIIIDEDMYERLNDLFNNINVWREPLLSIINKVFHTNANSLIYLYEN
jgi:hypothetical protein